MDQLLTTRVAMLGFGAALACSASGQDFEFGSSFGGTTSVSLGDAAANVTGSDPAVPVLSDWTALENLPAVGFSTFQYKQNPNDQQLISIAADPTDASNSVLRYFADGPNDLTSGSRLRIAQNIYDLDSINSAYITSHVFLGDDFSLLSDRSNGIGWLTLSEYWGQGDWNASFDFPFRITLSLKKSPGVGNPLYFAVDGQRRDAFVPGDGKQGSWQDVWDAENRSVEVPIGSWFTTETFLLDGDGDTGRFVFAVTPEGGERQVVFDITNWTRNPADPDDAGFWGLSPMKLYTGNGLPEWMQNQGGAFEVFWDDFYIKTGVNGLLDGFPTVADGNVVDEPIAFRANDVVSPTKGEVVDLLVGDVRATLTAGPGQQVKVRTGDSPSVETIAVDDDDLTGGEQISVSFDHHVLLQTLTLLGMADTSHASRSWSDGDSFQLLLNGVLLDAFTFGGGDTTGAFNLDLRLDPGDVLTLVTGDGASFRLRGYTVQVVPEPAALLTWSVAGFVLLRRQPRG